MCRVRLLLSLAIVLSLQPILAQQQVPPGLQRLMPLPEDTPREIRNPYWAKPAWKLWARDPGPVQVDKDAIVPPAEKDRKYPFYAEKAGNKLQMLPIKGTSFAGLWDDAYMSLDNYHTRLRYPNGLFIVAGKSRHSFNHAQRMKLGVTFTSQSYAARGRHIVDDLVNNLNTERNFFFANCVRATPSHASYEDKDEKQVKEIYDGLHAHSYHSIGQSGSEIHALYKMMVAGGAMPRETKNLLKYHGAYAIAVLTLFKAGLPYADAEGKELPYENELRHRPAYSSKGVPQHGHYCPANFYYHGYDDELHLRNMVEMAKGMTSAPPVALIKLVDLAISLNGNPLPKVEAAKRVKGPCLTSIRLWGRAGETVTATIDLTKSYDLQGQDLTFTCKELYPNQKNVRILEKTSGRYTVTVKHDPKLPKGRIPVICVARNKGTVPSNPVFLNFYFAGEKEMADRFHGYRAPKQLQEQIRKLGLKKLPVTVNLRPIVETKLAGDAVACKPGETVSLDLVAKDPEGYPIRIYRRSGEFGTLKGTRFTATIPENAEPGVRRAHLVFSDGTGGYAGRVVKLLVSKAKPKLPEGFAISVLGWDGGMGQVSTNSPSFTFQDRPLPPKNTRQLQGVYAFRTFSNKTADIEAHIPKPTGKAYVGLLLTNSLDAISRRIAIGYVGDTVDAQTRPTALSWNDRHTKITPAMLKDPHFYRLVTRNGTSACFASADGDRWLQVRLINMGWFRTFHGGIVYGGSKGPVNCEWRAPKGALPIVTHNHRAKRVGKNGPFQAPLEIKVDSPKDCVVRYTLDGSMPAVTSPEAGKAFKLEKPGKTVVTATAFHGKQAQGTTVVNYELSPPAAPEREQPR